MCIILLFICVYKQLNKCSGIFCLFDLFDICFSLFACSFVVLFCSLFCFWSFCFVYLFISLCLLFCFVLLCFDVSCFVLYLPFCLVRDDSFATFMSLQILSSRCWVCIFWVHVCIIVSNPSLLLPLLSSLLHSIIAKHTCKVLFLSQDNLSCGFHSTC